MQDRFCGGVHLPGSLIEFPSLVLSIHDTDIERLQQGFPGPVKAHLCAPLMDASAVSHPHMCHECAPSQPAKSAAEALRSPGTYLIPMMSTSLAPHMQGCTTSALSPQGGEASRTSLASDMLQQGHLGQRASADLNQDADRQGSQINPGVASEVSKGAIMEGRLQTFNSQTSPHHHSKEGTATDELSCQCETFVSDHDRTTVFDVMAWYVSGRSIVQPPYLPRCLPFPACERRSMSDGESLRAAQSMHGGGGGGPDRNVQQQRVTTLNRTAPPTSTRPQDEVRPGEQCGKFVQLHAASRCTFPVESVIRFVACRARLAVRMC